MKKTPDGSSTVVWRDAVTGIEFVWVHGGCFAMGSPPSEQGNACCPGAAATAIEAGRHLGAKEAESISYATSYERSPGESFVGYVGILF